MIKRNKLLMMNEKSRKRYVKLLKIDGNNKDKNKCVLL